MTLTHTGRQSGWISQLKTRRIEISIRKQTVWSSRPWSGTRQVASGTAKRTDVDEIAKAIADNTHSPVVEWAVETPRRMLDAIQPLCDATDKFLLDNPGYKVTFIIER